MRTPKRITTIKDIARVLDISVATVSRALRDTYDVSSETRQKVLKAAEALKYRPNYNATGLVQKFTHTIGILLPSITNYYFSTVITGIQEIAQEKGYHIVLYLTNDSAETEQQILKELPRSSLDGLLACVSSGNESSTLFKELMEDGIPVVFFDRVVKDLPGSRIMQDDYHGAFSAVEHLFHQGYKRIAHITGPPALLFTEKRLQGYRDALKSFALEQDDSLVIHSGFSQKDGYTDMRQLLDHPHQPDAIFAVNDRKAIGAILQLKEAGIQVGKEIGVIGFTNDPMSEIISPSLSTVAEPALEIGKKSCTLLLNHIRKSDTPAEEIILAAELIIRESTQRS